MTMGVRCALCGRKLKYKHDVFLRKWEYHHCSIECYEMDMNIIMLDVDEEDLKKLDISDEFPEYYDADCDNDVFNEPFDDMDEELI